MQSYTLLLVKRFWIRKFIPIFAQFTKKRAMIKENFIKLYENSFRENWDLPCYTDYGEDTQYTYGEVAEKIARLHLLFKHCSLRRGDKISVIGKKQRSLVHRLYGNHHVWSNHCSHPSRLLPQRCSSYRQSFRICISVHQRQHFGTIWKEEKI